MKTAGVIFIILSVGSVGFRISAALKYRCRILRKLISALHLLEHELTFSGTPLPRAFTLMADAVEGCYQQIFGKIAQKMNKTRWLTPISAMEQALRECPDEQTGEILMEFAGNIGRYDIDMQIKGIDIARTRLEGLVSVLEKERSVKSKTYETLGICAGLAAVILLI